MREWLAAAAAAVDAAGAAIRPHFRAGFSTETKDDDSPVTVADKNSELAIREVLRKFFPAHGVLGEEFGAEVSAARHVWVIDPIDGTRAFITGRPSFCTLLALLEDGVPVLGVIDQPVTGERWVACRGVAPVFAGRFGGRLGTRTGTMLAAAELSATAPEMFKGRMPDFERLRAACRRVYWGGDAYAYGLLALGQIDVVAECSMKPWDWAALVPVVEAAGGVMSDWQGRALRLDGDGSVLAAANTALRDAALKILNV